ncbi:SBBP repeat-containing protein [bacterium]|nr:SBBP repeat-containing protein [bacterium]
MKRLFYIIGIAIIFFFACTTQYIENFDEDVFQQDEDIQSDDDEIGCEESDASIWDNEFNELSIWTMEKLKNGNYLSLGSYTEFLDGWYVDFSSITWFNSDLSVKKSILFNELTYGKNYNDVIAVGDGTTAYAAGTNNGRSFLLSYFSDTSEVLWEKAWKYGGFDNSYENNLGRIESFNDALYVSGIVTGYDVAKYPTAFQIYLAKLTLQGEVLWEKMFGPEGSLINGMAMDSEGNIYLTGYSAGSLNGATNPSQPGDCSLLWGANGSACPRPILIKLDSDGAVLWSRQWGSSVKDSIEWGLKVLVDIDDSIFVLSDVTAKDKSGKLSIRKFDKKGAPLFNQKFTDFELGSNFLEESIDIYIDKNNKLIVALRAREKDVPTGGIILKLDKVTGTIVQIKNLVSHTFILPYTLFETDEGLAVSGSELIDYYYPDPQNPDAPFPIYKYGIKHIGYFYNDPHPDTTITTGDEFERETIQFGSEKYDEAIYSFKDSENNLFVIGNSYGTIGDATQLGSKDVFVTKYDSAKTREWIAYYGSDDWDSASSAYEDSEGNIVITGVTWGSFEGGEQLGERDVFVLKVSKDGTILWSKQVGSPNDDWSNSVWIDKSDDIFVGGGTRGLIGESEIQRTYRANGFIFQLDKDGEQKNVNHFMKGVEVFSVTGSEDGDIYCAGRTDFEYGGNLAYDNGVSDNIIIKLNENLWEQWARLWGCDAVDNATAVALDSDENIYVVGYTFGSIDGEAYRGADCSGGNCPDAYLTKWTQDGEKQWTRQFGSENGDRAFAVQVDNSDSIYVSGTTEKNRYCEKRANLFFTEFDGDGTMIDIKRWGTAGEEKLNSMNINRDSVILSGTTTGGLDGNKNTGQRDAFVTEL